MKSHDFDALAERLRPLRLSFCKERSPLMVSTEKESEKARLGTTVRFGI